MRERGGVGFELDTASWQEISSGKDTSAPKPTQARRYAAPARNPAPPMTDTSRGGGRPSAGCNRPIERACIAPSIPSTRLPLARASVTGSASAPSALPTAQPRDPHKGRLPSSR